MLTFRLPNSRSSFFALGLAAALLVSLAVARVTDSHRAAREQKLTDSLKVLSTLAKTQHARLRVDTLRLDSTTTRWRTVTKNVLVDRPVPGPVVTEIIAAGDSVVASCDSVKQTAVALIGTEQQRGDAAESLAKLRREPFLKLSGSVAWASDGTLPVAVQASAGRTVAVFVSHERNLHDLAKGVTKVGISLRF